MPAPTAQDIAVRRAMITYMKSSGATGCSGQYMANPQADGNNYVVVAVSSVITSMTNVPANALAAPVLVVKPWTGGMSTLSSMATALSWPVTP